jgi:hypothetical protein
VTDPVGASSTASLKIYAGNTPPGPVIKTPVEGTTFGVGETISLTAEATDMQDGVLPDSSLSWKVLLHHDTHTHPYVDTTIGKTLSLQMPSPEGLEAVHNSYLEIYLSAKDSTGLRRTVKRLIYPSLVNLTFAAEPAGLMLEVHGTALTTPQTISSWKGYRFNIKASNQTFGNQQAIFQTWSDGGTASHMIGPKADRTFTASFSLE